MCVLACCSKTERVSKRENGGKKCANKTLNYQRFFPLCLSYMECLPLGSQYIIILSYGFSFSRILLLSSGIAPLLCFEGYLKCLFSITYLLCLFISWRQSNKRSFILKVTKLKKLGCHYNLLNIAQPEL